MLNKQYKQYMKKLTTLIGALALSACTQNAEDYCDDTYWQQHYQPDTHEEVPTAIHTYQGDSFASPEGSDLITRQIESLNETFDNNMLYEGMFASAQLEFVVKEWHIHADDCRSASDVDEGHLNIRYCAQASQEQTIAARTETASAVTMVGYAGQRYFDRAIAKSLGIEHMYCKDNDCTLAIKEEGDTIFLEDEVATMRCTLGHHNIIPFAYDALLPLLYQD